MTEHRRIAGRAAARAGLARRYLRAATLALCLVGSGASAQDELAEAAAQLEQAPQVALAAAEDSLARDPGHIDALLIKARALAALGQPRAARQAALAAYRAADVAPARYVSAMILADVLSQNGQHTFAQYWLRRAVQHTRSEAEVTRVASAYAHVKRENPWAFRFSLGAAPNSNVNNGSSERIIAIQGLPFVLSPTARALDGYTAEATAAVQYRFAETATSQSHIGIEAAGRMNWLTPASQAAAPGASGRDFDYHAVTLIGRHVQLLDSAGTLVALSGQVGRTWYGGAKLTDRFGAGLALTLPVAGGQDSLTLTGRSDRVLHARPGRAHETVGHVGASYVHQLDWGDHITGRLGYSKSVSANAVQEYSMPEVSLSYAFDTPVLGTIFTLGAHYGYKDYKASPYTNVGRQDHMVGVEVSAEFRDLAYMGFAPVVSLQANRSVSNVSLYSQQSLSAGISLQSRF